MQLHRSIENLKLVYDKSDKFDKEIGLEAYRKYHKMMGILAKKYGCSINQSTAVFVSTSPNNDFKNNLRSTISILDGWKRELPEDQIRISTYNHCRKRALEYLNGFDFLEQTKGLKIRSFYKNIIDPENREPVTVDGHMLGTWIGKRMRMKEATMARFKYREAAEDIRTLARQIGIIPCQLQAILWFTWKRIHKVVYNSNLNLFGDHWGMDIDVTKIKPFVIKPFEI